ncbi:hypothetical protein GCM10008090_07040 [Arenicella chitinivorans]|uniref:Sulfotransferase domain-containing protein n=1 Tax=Arenicella chitinivorans TaxID=1329800 RepID=A0A918RHY0_9GAMM|nr:sulfotransferase domain-containing protein [Arenicella chitinivorans]GHA00681.1 hypothetical protein GCM10008090_07040 [Arenicella chitinivorans]
MSPDSDHILRQKLFLNSIPKSGTHLLTGITQMLGFRHTGEIIAASTALEAPDSDTSLLVGVSSPAGIDANYFDSIISNIAYGHFHYGHIPYSRLAHEILEQSGISMIMIYRDPRAVALSLVNFVLKLPDHPYHNLFASLESREDQLKSVVLGLVPEYGSGDPVFLPLDKWYDSMMGWIDYPNIHFLDYEDVVGIHGGGDQRKQFDAIQQLSAFLDLGLDSDQIHNVQSNVFDPGSSTFHRGSIDYWKSQMSERLTMFFDSHATQALNCYRKLKSSGSALRTTQLGA